MITIARVFRQERIIKHTPTAEEQIRCWCGHPRRAHFDGSGSCQTCAFEAYVRQKKIECSRFKAA